MPRQIMELDVLGEVFDPAQLEVRLPQWSIPRDWGTPPQPLDVPMAVSTPSTDAVRTVGGQPERREPMPARESISAL
jgi:hypothetical protein